MGLAEPVDVVAPAPGGLLGRTGQLAELAALLEGERLVTLTGAPGIGKTRLALELAAQLGGGACVVGLAPVVRPAHVVRAVASALSVDESPGREPIDSIVARLGSRGHTLLVLDNCEHLLGACAKLVDALLSCCPQLRILTTSREPLALAGERVWRVPPLRVPGPRVEASPEVLLGYAGVALFVERAHAAQPGFALNAYVAPAVAEICRRLDGIPLAIELAAARVQSLTPQEIARRLEDRFGLLTNGAGGDLARHQTLEAALDWSHALLSDPERALLRRLAVFAGGFEPEAAESVCAGGPIEPAEVGDLLARLAAKSLVVADPGRPAGRCRLLETIRAYAADRLDEAGEQAALRSAHAGYHLELAERAEPQLTGPHQRQWLERLEAERANLRCAIEWSLAHGQSEQALRLTGALVLFWRVRCHFSEGRELLDAALTAGPDAASELRAKVLWGVGFMTLMMGEIDAAVFPLEQSLACFRELGDRQGCARALLLLGNCGAHRDGPSALSLLQESASLAREAGDSWCLVHALGVAGNTRNARHELSAARPLFEECLAVARAAEDLQGMRYGLLGLGLAAMGQGDFPLAQSAVEEALAVAGELGDDYGRGNALQYLGELAIGRGDYARARELLDRALDLYREVGQPVAEMDAGARLAEAVHCEGGRRDAHRLFDEALTGARAMGGTHYPTLIGLGRIAAEGGNRDPARGMFEEVLEVGRTHGDKVVMAHALHELGELARSEGQLKRAAALHDEALERRREVGSAPAIVASIEAVGGLAAVGGRHEYAARLLGAASALREHNGYARSPWESSRFEADLALLGQVLSATELDVAVAAGTALSLQDAAATASKGRWGRPVSGWSSLTESERQVAILVSAGLTNPQIAPRLYISPRTVKRRLVRVFAKLGVESRTELAREVHRRGYDAQGERRLG